MTRLDLLRRMYASLWPVFGRPWGEGYARRTDCRPPTREEMLAAMERGEKEREP